MTLLHHAGVQRWLATHMLCAVPGAGPRFALSFDDGPSPRNTSRLLDALAACGARATFFVIARRLRRHAALARRVLAEGHEIGIHGDFHVPAWSLPPAGLARDLDSAVRIAVDVTGQRPRHYRAPFGLLWPSQVECVRSRGMRPVLGNVYPRDHAVRRPEVIVQRVLRRLVAGSIVILHDSSAVGDFDRTPTITAVKPIVDGAAERGLQAVTVANLVDAAAAGEGGGPPRA